jgi:hypothetical protein
MQIIFGALSITGLESILNPQNAWLLLAGFPDPQQAGWAATNFIVNVKHIPNGSAVAVTGTPTSVGNQPAIVMSDVNVSGGLEQHATPQAVTAREAKSASRRSKSKRSST